MIDPLDLDRPMPPDVDAAFELYRADGQRSLRRTADLLNLPHGTVLGWSTRYRWQQRLAAIDAEHRGDVLRAVQAAVAAQTLQSLNVMIAIRDDLTTPPAVRLSAARDIAGMGGLAPVQRATLAVSADATASGYSDAELSALTRTPEGIAQLLALQSNASRSPD